MLPSLRTHFANHYSVEFCKTKKHHGEEEKNTKKTGLTYDATVVRCRRWVHSCGLLLQL